MTEMRPTPSEMKNAIDLRRPATTIIPDYAEICVGCGTRRRFWNWPLVVELGACRSLDELRGFALRHPACDIGYVNRFRDPQRFEDLDQNPRRVQLVPCQTMPGRSGMCVVIVVPALAECHERNPPVIAGIVPCGEAPRAPHVRGRVHQPGGVQTERHAHKDAPQH